MKLIRRIGSGLAAAALGLGLAVGASSAPAQADTHWGYDSPAPVVADTGADTASGAGHVTEPRILFDTHWGYD